jgi:hypothetical protein
LSQSGSVISSHLNFFESSEGRLILEHLEHPFTVLPEPSVLVSLVEKLQLAGQFEGLFWVLPVDCLDPDSKAIFYRLPGPDSARLDATVRCQTLETILTQPVSRKLFASNLRHRLDLAKTLSTAVMHMHSVGWTHGMLRPENIIFFGHEHDDICSFEWAQPYLVGFCSGRIEFESGSGPLTYRAMGGT